MLGGNLGQVYQIKTKLAYPIQNKQKWYAVDTRKYNPVEFMIKEDIKK